MMGTKTDQMGEKQAKSFGEKSDSASTCVRRPLLSGSKVGWQGLTQGVTLRTVSLRAFI